MTAVMTLSPPSPTTALRTGVRMFFASIVTLLLIVALLGFALNVLLSGGYMAKAPQGQAAMGLVIPFFGTIIAGLALVLAGVIAGVQGRATIGALLQMPAGWAGLLVPVASLGIAGLAFMVFLFWVEPAAAGHRLGGLTAVLGWIGGILAPLLMAAVLLVGVWMPPGQPIDDAAGRMMLRVVVLAVGVLSLAGYVLGGAGAYQALAYRARVRADVIRERLEFDEKWRVHNAKPQAQRVREGLAEMSETTPLWPIVTYLTPASDGHEATDETRRLVVERTLKVPNLDQELLATMGSQYALYRQGCAEFIAHAPEPALREHEAAWAKALVAGIDATTERVACRPAWLSETFDLNPDPLGHIRSLLAAAGRFRGTASAENVDGALKRLAAATDTLARDGKLEKLAATMRAAGYPIPE